MLTRLMCTAKAVADGHHDIDTIAALSCGALEPLGLTGMQLTGDNGRLMYCLEGEGHAVRTGYAHLLGDPGLRDVSLVTMVAVHARHFDQIHSMPVRERSRPEGSGIGIESALALLQAAGRKPAAAIAA